MPFSAIGLIWNSVVSVASGWFVLIPCEMLTFGTHDFRLPGLGSYLYNAAAASPVDNHALFWGIAVLIFIIVATDQLIWRPLIAWSDKFKFEQVESASRVTSPILALLSRPSLLLSLPSRAFNRVEESIYHRLARTPACRRVQPIDEEPGKGGRLFTVLIAVCAGVAALWAAGQAVHLLRDATLADLRLLFLGAGATFLRVAATLTIAALWTIPAGVLIGSNPRLAQILQPITQIAASIPASAFFPVLMVVMLQQGMGLGFGAILLMLLGTQWYVLFNVIAGAMAIPSDLKEAAAVYKFTRWQRWCRLILPGIFPYLITGMVTASGGAWNASILAEYGTLGSRTLQTIGLGAQISAALAPGGKLASLILATVLLAAIVVTVNRLVWRRLYRLAETRYKLEG
jgi:NitT/TauT family transport system permease protein